MTEQKEKITRVVQPIETNRIRKIEVDETLGEISGVQEYTVRIPDKGETGKLGIVTYDLTDEISIDGGTTWEKGMITEREISIPNKENEIPFKIRTTNGTILDYKLIVVRLNNNNGLESVAIKGVGGTEITEGTQQINATKLDDTHYYAIIPGDKTEVEVIGRAEEALSEISVDGIGKTKEESTATVKIL